MNGPRAEAFLPDDATHLPADHAERMKRARLSLLGLSIGDSLGQQMFYAPQLIGRRELPPPRWRYTDDTAMALSIVTVLDSWGAIHQDMLAACFADEHEADPHRGYGGGAHRILLDIAGGEDWRSAASAVFDGEGSMGNGGAMRVAPVGGYFADDLAAAAENARKSAEVTHAHSDGQAGAIAVAVAAARAWQIAQTGGEPLSLIETALAHTPSGPTREGLKRALTIPLEADVQTAVAALGNGSRVISSDTVPFCLWCAARHLNSYEDAFWTTVSGLGDRDTTCAIVGGIVALTVGEEGIPDEWRYAREPF